MINAITGGNIQLYEHLKNEIKKATELKFIVSFLMESGVKLIIDDLEEAILKGATLKIITGTYLNITEPSALYYLKNRFNDKVDLRFYSDSSVSFHPKTYIINQGDEGVLFIGSSNISRAALTNGIEWNYRLFKNKSLKDYIDFEKNFDYIYNNQSIEVTDKVLRDYAFVWKKPKIFRGNQISKKNDLINKPEPRGAQIEALYELKMAREEGIDKGMVVAATGVGKTYLAAFDCIQFKKVLFIAHRKEILEQAKTIFEKVRGNMKYGYFNSEYKDTTSDIIFASVQTLGKKEYLNRDYFIKDYFDYIIIDEFHHAAADSYKNILNYFKPKFLLGLTATPYRMDNKDIYELCDNNVIYELNLKDSINRGLLVPFKYYGIYDDTDYEKIKYVNGKYDVEQLEKALSTNKRADLILNHYLKLGGKRTLGFCTSINHAEYMAKYFNKHGIKAVSVHSSNKNSRYKMERDKALEKLQNRDIEVIFSVDIFNEGVDVPSIDTVLFLRPTESYVVFLQQLGRGLRRFPNKEYLTVIDFIGNYKRAHYIPKLLAGENPIATKENFFPRIEELDFPEDCIVNFEFNLIDLFEEMRKRDPLRKIMRDEFYRLKNEIGRRPMRVDIYEGIDIPIREFLNDGYLNFLKDIGELNEIEESWIGTIVEDFLKEIEKTSMTKSYKIPVLKTFINNGIIKSSVTIEEVGKSFMSYYKNNKTHQKDLNNKKHENWKEWGLNKFSKEALRNPIKYLSRTRFFNYDEINKVFSLNSELANYLSSSILKQHLEDILKYREIDYFRRRYKEDL
jgi:superfamily II DNA or RNA helicase/HKD family nuclease